jgi:uncharacterized protein DUF2066
MVYSGFSTTARGLCLVLAALLATVVWGGVSAPTLGQANAPAGGPGDPFTVSGIEEDVTADTAQGAREKAVADGQRQAFQTLVQRLAPAGSQSRLPKLSARDIDNLVLDYEVEEEHASSVRYVGRLTYRFKPSAVKQLFQDSGIALSETQSLPVVVVPVLRAEGGASQLWDDPNPWRDAWAKIASPNGLVPLIMPLGDLQDLNLITADKALAEDPKSLAALAQHYNAGGVLIATAMPSANGQVAVKARLIQNGAARTVMDASIAAKPGTDPLEEAARQAESALETAWKSESASPGGAAGPAASLSVDVVLSSLNDWIEIRKRLASVPLITRIGVTALTRSEAVLDLGYAGDPQELALALAQRELTLAQNAGGWTLRRADAPAPVQ